MKRITIALLTGVIVASFSTGSAQETPDYKQKIEQLKLEREKIREEEKQKLKAEVEAILQRLDKGEISPDQARELKEEAARKRALNIENRLAILDNQIALLERNQGEEEEYGPPFIELGWGGEHEDGTRLFGIRVGDDLDEKDRKYDRRTYSDFLFAFGLNNALIEGQSLNESPYRFGGSRFFELGYQWRTRVFRNSNWLRFHYGFSFQFNGLKPEGNQYLVNENGQVELTEFEFSLDKSKFRMDNLVFPVHFEFGPSRLKETQKTIRYSIRRKFRFAIGGYGGFNLGARQKLKYTENGQDRKEKLLGEYNTNKLIYGLSSYIGVGGTTLYIKYDLNPIFRDAVIEQNNISLGLRFDL